MSVDSLTFVGFATAIIGVFALGIVGQEASRALVIVVLRVATATVSRIALYNILLFSNRIFRIELQAEIESCLEGFTLDAREGANLIFASWDLFRNVRSILEKARYIRGAALLWPQDERADEFLGKDTFEGLPLLLAMPGCSAGRQRYFRALAPFDIEGLALSPETESLLRQAGFSKIGHLMEMNAVDLSSLNTLPNAPLVASTILSQLQGLSRKREEGMLPAMRRVYDRGTLGGTKPLSQNPYRRRPPRKR